ncbi:MAG: STAS domain-containing protein [Clostridiales bacterium]|nr:STAS domain-containing protein [Clostridiales bacterium]
MPVRIENQDGIITAFIMGDIDHHSAKEIRETIDFALESSLPETLILDFKDVTFMDSSGIGLVMGRYKLMQSMNGQLRIQNVSSHMKKVMRLAGLDKLATFDK